MKIRNVFFMLSLLATLLFQANHPVHSFASVYGFMAFEDLVHLPSHILFIMPYALLALASSERAISLNENRALVIGRLSGRKEFTHRILKVLAQDISLYGFLHVAFVFTISLITGNMDMTLFSLLAFLRVIVLNAMCATMLLALSLWMERSIALMAWFSSLVAVSSIGLAELHRFQPFFYRFNLFVSCMIIDERVFGSWLAIAIWTGMLIALFSITTHSLMKGDWHD